LGFFSSFLPPLLFLSVACAESERGSFFFFLFLFFFPFFPFHFGDEFLSLVQPVIGATFLVDLLIVFKMTVFVPPLTPQPLHTNTRILPLPCAHDRLFRRFSPTFVLLFSLSCSIFCIFPSSSPWSLPFFRLHRPGTARQGGVLFTHPPFRSLIVRPVVRPFLPPCEDFFSSLVALGAYERIFFDLAPLPYFHSGACSVYASNETVSGRPQDPFAWVVCFPFSSFECRFSGLGISRSCSALDSVFFF